MRHQILPILLVALWLTACPDPGPPPDDDDVVIDDDDAVDDDDSATDDDDSAAPDDDDATEDPTPAPEPILTPPGAEVGVPGTMVGLRATGELDSLLWTSNSVEVTLVAPPPDAAPPPPDYGDELASTVDPDLIVFDQLLKEVLVPALQASEEVAR